MSALRVLLFALAAPQTSGVAPSADAPAQTADEPASVETAAEATSGAAPTLSWDVLGGGIPDGGVIASARVGFSRLGEIRLEVPILDGLMVGAWLGFDVGFWTPEGAGADPGLVFGATARYRILHTSEWSIGVSASPGGRARFGSSGGGELLVPLAGRALYAVDSRILVGLALDVPVRFGFPDVGGAFFAIPLSVGFAGELHLLPPLAITANLGVGPALDTRGVETALRGTLGVGYRL